ncbi:hypothetical protein GA0070609_1898 [Micromonospora echinaurantiaca]|uniref:Integral membrane protein n=1 Tax=Micromonospora echinaurantiaca TaxID=47857 RepID=A0A1C5HNT9_9ACTN|nr:hypothetical protein [Micromonospora echinaurantiaca]SCG47251.1 hypothetical protein GA0070609_1898 [Micromonospora echinaurantiaca]
MSDGPAASYDVVELRVHGVSGAGADQVLDRPNVAQVAGDRSGGFFRPRPGYPDTRGSAGVVLEAYRWSDLPSGTAIRTLSLVFLLPFMLCNVAIWMRPRGLGRSELVLKALCRVLALSLTALYVLSIVGVALDLVAWRCLASPQCLSERTWLSWLGDRPAGLRLAVLSIVPIAAIGLVWRLGARPGRNFDAFRAPRATTTVHQLSAVGQWDAAPLVGRLRSIHVAVAFGTLDAALLTARARAGAAPATVVLAVATGAVLVTCVVLVCAHPAIDQTEVGRRVDRVARWLRFTASGLTVLVLVVVAAHPAPWPAAVGLPGHGEMVTYLLVFQTLLLAGLGALVLWVRVRRSGWRRRGRHGGGPLRALGAPIIAAAATGLAVAFSAELVYRAADFLDRNEPTADRVALSPPLMYKWAIFGFFLAVLTMLLAAALVTVLTRRGRLRAAAATVARDFPDAPPEAAARLRQVTRTIARARFTERLEPLAAVYACLIALGMATSVLGLLDLHPGEFVQRYLGVPADMVNFGIGMGSYAVAGVVLVLVMGGIFAYRTAEFRRYIGVLWDLGTFWPRAAHPFAPPCYAERAVPELGRRITYLAESGVGVLLAGHSHGSVLLAATVLQLPAHVSDRVALLTYGSPLRRLYTRLFPEYVNPDVLREVGDRVGWRWVNLWRDTDQIGSWIFSPHRLGEPPAAPGPAGTVDRRLRDPWDVVPPPSDSVPPPILGHWPAESDDRFAEAVRELAERLRRQAYR